MPPKKAKLVVKKQEVLEKEDHRDGDDDDNDVAHATNTNSPVKAKSRHDVVKCTSCKSRGSRRGCTQLRCLLCCTDQECGAHAESRGRASYHEDLLRGTTEIMRQATQMRSRTIVPNRYRDSGFIFTQQTIKIWDIREFLNHSKWKEDAIRKAQKRMLRRQQEEQEESNATLTTITDATTPKTTTTPTPPPRLKISRKRFHSVMEELYQKSLEC